MENGNYKGVQQCRFYSSGEDPYNLVPSKSNDTQFGLFKNLVYIQFAAKARC